MKDELTNKMHSEFQIDEETEKKHKVWTLLTLCGTEDKECWTKYMDGYGVTMQDIENHIDSYIELQTDTED